MFTLGEQWSFTCIYIFSDTLFWGDDAPRKTYDMSLYIIEREHQAVSESVISPPFIASDNIDLLEPF